MSCRAAIELVLKCLLWSFLAFGSMRSTALAEAAEVNGQSPEARDDPAATWTDVRDFRSGGLFLAGVATAFFAHEAGHVGANLVQGNVPRVRGILGWGFIPFFTLDPQIKCRDGQCKKRDGSAFSTGLPGKVAITSAGFNVQHLTNEVLLSQEPRLRYRVAPFRKGMLAFNLLLSVGYAFSALTRIENGEGDVTHSARLAGIPREAYASALLLIAGLDTYRYFCPSSRWAPWVSRTSKAGFIGVVFAL